ncbi:peptidase M23 [Actinoplanes sp. TFC3]|uniref:peptidase M23 n=1 Tax=Actinoplanes sp. TFC3 TaxID=1710355 RepID=UPI00082AAEB6|nr:peptidase M23 [Actinoplanes sp. TFC3]
MRALFVVAAAVLLGFVLSPMMRTDAATCTPRPAASVWDGWSKEQVSNARLIVTIGKDRRVPVEGQVIAVATALQESRLRNLPGGDRDSVGLFQQRTSQGWGTPRQLSDPAYQTRKFYDKLLKIDGWQKMRLTDAAQAVQVSAYPKAYARHAGAAAGLVGALNGAGSCSH